MTYDISGLADDNVNQLYHFTFYMVRKFRRFSRRTRRRYRRRGFRRRKSLRARVASINRRLASEVKKNDNVIAITQTQMTQLTDVGLNDYAYCYPVLDQSMA